MSETSPLIQLDEDGQASVIDYNIPEPRAHSFRRSTGFAYKEDLFKKSLLEPRVTKTKAAAKAKGKSKADARAEDADGPKLFGPGGTPLFVGDGGLSGSMPALRDAAVLSSTIPGNSDLDRLVVNPGLIRRIDRDLLPPVLGGTITITQPLPAQDVVSVVGAAPLPPGQDETPADALVPHDVVHQCQSGTVTTTSVLLNAIAKPMIHLVEVYRLSSHLGNYGAGRTIETFSLLPGEKTKISIKTFRSLVENASETSSIVDSSEQSVVDEFEETLFEENTEQASQDSTLAFHAEVSGSGSVGFASAEVSAGVSGETNNAREEFAKNTAEAVSRNASEAASKREVQVNSTTETTSEQTDETAIERTIENINASRTLNFVFRQMNQEYISVLALVDVRVGFYAGFPGSAREVPLSGLNKLLDEICRDKESQNVIHNDLRQALDNIYDWHGQHMSIAASNRAAGKVPDGQDEDTKEKAERSFVLERHYEEDSAKNEFLLVNRHFKTRVTAGFGDTQLEVPGIVTNVQSNVMPTEGVIVEALLGQGLALDEYSLDLQAERIRSMRASNEALELENLRQRKALDILESGDTNKAQLFSVLFPPEPSQGDTGDTTS